MHFKEEKRSRKWLVLLIVAELILAAAFSYAIYYISWEHITGRRSDAIVTSMAGFNTKPMTKNMDKFVKKARERIIATTEDTMWTTEEVNYRVGPDESYEKAGTLWKYAEVYRTGVTYNKWSRIVIDDEEYYVFSKYLTKEQPLVTAGGAKGELQRYALSLMPSYGWKDTEIIPLIKLWDRESGWNPKSHNKSSGAHGIPQALPASKMASEGSDYYTNGRTQIRWGLGYIRSRYGSPSAAWSHFQSSGWY